MYVFIKICLRNHNNFILVKGLSKRRIHNFTAVHFKFVVVVVVVVNEKYFYIFNSCAVYFITIVDSAVNVMYFLMVVEC